LPAWRAPADENAEAAALAALAYLLADDDRAARFLTMTGLAAAELRHHAADPAFLGGVLDFVLEDEPLLVGAAAAAGLRPERVAILRQRLPGAPPRN
jgi:hypothetical protein